LHIRPILEMCAYTQRILLAIDRLSADTSSLVHYYGATNPKFREKPGQAPFPLSPFKLKEPGLDIHDEHGKLVPFNQLPNKLIGSVVMFAATMNL
jgi:hypothetical protein